jgi:voltage-gated potassium channel Kch
MEETSGKKFLVAFYWSLQTIFTVGYGDISPVTLYERLFAMIWMIVGIGFYSYTLGNMTSIIMDFDKSHMELSDKLDVIKNYVR